MSHTQPPMYLRFVVGTNRTPASSQAGVVTELRILSESGRLPDYEVEHVLEIFSWLNAELPCPPFGNGIWSSNAVSWFKDSAHKMIATFREIVSILEQYGRPTRMIKTRTPGEILYEDDFQIVADSPLF